jgi:hypothetical protein
MFSRTVSNILSATTPFQMKEETINSINTKIIYELDDARKAIKDLVSVVLALIKFTISLN